jgi:hypothetical protein
MTQKTKKTKSPPVPSYDLESSYENTEKLYDQYSHAEFSKSEIASTLGLSATSSTVVRRIFSMTEYNLLEEDGEKYKVTQHFHSLRTNEKSSHQFKQAALDSIKGSDIFKTVLDEFSDKLPNQDALAQRLETSMKFNQSRAKETSSILKRSLQFAGILDQNNNILPIRSAPEEKTDKPESVQEIIDTDFRRTEVPLDKGRVVVVNYPHDLTTSEAEKIANVLKALVS